MEEFKDVKGYEGHYKVSNLGNVISLKHGKVKALKQDGYNGYKCIRLSKNNKNRKFIVHRLVAEAFLNTNIKGLTVNHIDLNKSNNCVENLEVISL